MKLYEFTFKDNTNLTESEVLAVLQEDLKEEAILQQWASGYKLQQRQKPVRNSDGVLEYFWEVLGEYIDDGKVGEDKAKASSPKPTKPDAAAAP